MEFVSDAEVPMRRSTSSLVLALAAGGLLALSPMHANAADFTFDSDLEGWEAVGIDIDFTAGLPPTLNNITLVQNPGDMVHEAAGGNPGGYARLTDAIEEPSSLAGAPASFLNGGDLTSFIGGTFSSSTTACSTLARPSYRLRRTA